MNPCGFICSCCGKAPVQVLVLHLQSLKEGVWIKNPTLSYSFWCISCHCNYKIREFSVIHRWIIFFWDSCPRGKGPVLLELESAGTKVEGFAINKSNWKAVMKFERISLICEQSTYLVNFGWVVWNNIKHKEDDNEESSGFYCRSNGEVH